MSKPMQQAVEDSVALWVDFVTREATTDAIELAIFAYMDSRVGEEASIPVWEVEHE